MKIYRYVVFVILIFLAVLLLGSIAYARTVASRSAPPPLANAVAAAQPPVEHPQIQAAESFHSSPVMFIENTGQWDPNARYQVWGGWTRSKSTERIWLAEDGLWLTVMEKDVLAANSDKPYGRGLPSSSPASIAPNAQKSGINIKATFIDANPQLRIEPFDRLDTQFNYFKGSDPEQWRTGVPTWAGVRYRELYPGVDLVISSEDGLMTQQLIAQADADVHSVRLRLEGVRDAAVSAGMLQLQTDAGLTSMPLPRADFPYEIEYGDPGQRLTIDGADADGVLDAANDITDINGAGNVESGAITNDNPAALLLGTYLGGSGEEFGGESIVVDATGRMYITGGTESSNFPATSGSFDPTHNGGWDVFLAVLNPAGTSFQTVTFLGGSSWEFGRGLVLDSAGRAYLIGSVWSSDFPITSGAYDRTHNGEYDVFVARLNNNTLEYSTYVGGSARDGALGIVLGADLSAHIVGYTKSNDFPVTSGAYDSSYGGGYDGVAIKLSPDGANLSYSTYFGGNGDDWGTKVVLNGAQEPVFTGFAGINFPTTVGAYDTTYGGGKSDAFVARLNQSGSALLNSTYLGGGGDDFGSSVTLDQAGRIHLVGGTSSTGFPTTAGAYDQTYNGGDEDIYVTRFNAQSTALEYSTFLGGSGIDSANDISLQGEYQVYLAGYTSSTNIPTTTDAFDRSHNGGIDAYIAKLDTANSVLSYATYLGGSGDSSAWNLTTETDGDVYIVGPTDSSDFPTTLGAVDRTFNGVLDVFVAKLTTGNTGSPTPTPTFTPVPTSAPHCPAGGKVDVVFAMDTSGSMNDEFSALCSRIDDVVDELQSRGITVNQSILGINAVRQCATQIVKDFVPNGSVNHEEDWGPAVTDLSYGYPWLSGYTRLIITMSDEGPEDGNPVYDPGDDRNAISAAISAARTNNVIVSPLLGSGHPAGTVQLAQDLANSTGGRVFLSTDPADDLADAVIDMIGSAACTPIIHQVTPICGINSTTILTLLGGNFSPDASVIIGGIPARDVTVISTSEIRARVDPSLPNGVYDITIMNPPFPGGGSYTKPNAVTVGSCQGGPTATATPPLPTPTATPSFPTCTFAIDKVAYPTTAHIDGQVGVTLKLEGDCPSEIGSAIDVTLLIDRSDSMCGANLDQAQIAGQAFLDSMAFPPDQASVISFATTAIAHTGLTDVRTTAVNALYNITCGNLSRIDVGLNQVFVEMTGPHRVAGHVPAILLLTDGDPEGAYADDVRAAAQRVRDAGIQLFTVGLGSDVNAQLLREIATQPDYYYQSPAPEQLATIYTRLAGELRSVIAANVNLTDMVGDNFEIVPNSFSGPVAPQVNGDTLSWYIPRVEQGITEFSFSVKPQNCGVFPVNRAATVSYDDNRGQRYTQNFPIPNVTIEGCGADLTDVYMRDNKSDHGQLPSTKPWWVSPDVWVRHQNDGGTQHQNPQAGQRNYIYARVWNYSDIAVHNINLDFYYANPSLGLTWPNNWNRLYPSNSIATIAPGDYAIVSIPWDVINTPGHFCLFVRISSVQDPIRDNRVQWENNITQRNLHIIDYPQPTDGQCKLDNNGLLTDNIDFNVSNTQPNSSMVDLAITTSNLGSNAQIRLDPGPLSGRWASLDGLTMEADGRLLVTDFPARIYGVRLNPGEERTVQIEINAPANSRFTIGLTEMARGIPVGGNSYNRYLPPCPVLLPIVHHSLACPPGQYTPPDVVLVIDRSGSMDGAKMTAAKSAVNIFLNSMDLTQEQASIVSFADTARMDQVLTHDLGALQGVLSAIIVGGGTAIGEGIAVAHSELLSSRYIPSHVRTMIVLSDGQNNSGRSPIAAAQAAKAAGIRIVTIGLGTDADEYTLRLLASSPGDYYYSPGPEDLAAIYEEIAGSIRCEP